MGDVVRTKEEGTVNVCPVNADQPWEIVKTVFRWEGADAIEGLDEGIPCIFESEQGTKKYRKTWAGLIQKIGACPRLDRGRLIP